MPKLLQFLILYRQFLLRVIDLEALSIQADIPRFLGQFAGILIMFSLIHAAIAYGIVLRAPWYLEQHLIATMMLVAGLVAVISWDSIFPDRRDIMILAPLPVAPHIILLAKITALSAILSLAILSLNVASGMMCPLLLGSQHSSIWGYFQSFAAYWLTMTFASVFLYCAVIAIQGFIALLLPQRLFLRISAILQLLAFALFVGVYFLQPSLTTHASMAAPENHRFLASSPSFWFFALFNQLNGGLPSDMAWLAHRAWMSIAIATLGAVTSMLLCYLRTMKKIVEAPDLVPAARSLHWTPRLGNLLQTAIVIFSIRSLARSRQHRILTAFYLGLVFAIAFSWVRSDLSVTDPRPLNTNFLVSTFMMMSFAVFGLRNVFSLPVSLTANWVWRATQLSPTEKYIAAIRKSLLLFAVIPVCFVSSLLAFSFRPWLQIAGYIAVLALFGWIFTELSLIRFYKVPFTCSYLPGKVNLQFVFWGFLLLMLNFAITSAGLELRLLRNPFHYACMVAVLAVGGLALWIFNHRQAKQAVLYFEETEPEVITTLGLTRPTPAIDALGMYTPSPHGPGAPCSVSREAN